MSIDPRRLQWAAVSLLTTLAGTLTAACTSPTPGSCDPVCNASTICVEGRCVANTDVVGSDRFDATLDTSTDQPTVNMDIPTGVDIPGEASRIMGLGCSSDLRNVLGVNGAVLYACNTDEGCSNGRCIPVCQAADDSHGTIACEFAVPTPPAWSTMLPPCHGVVLANTWPTPARVTVRRGGMTFDVTRFGRIVDNARTARDWAPIPADGIPMGAVAVLFMSSDPNSIQPQLMTPENCPITPAVNMGTEIPATGTADAFVIRTNVPVSGYDIMPYGGASSHVPSAQLLLPTGVWGTSYVVAGPPAGTYVPAGPSWFQIVGRDSDTIVRIRPTVNLPAGPGVVGIMSGTTGTVMLQPGQIIQWQLPAGTGDPSGTLISAARPIGVFAGNRFLRLQTVMGPGGESAHQQLLPVSALSHRYVGAPYATRRQNLAPENIRYRMVGAVDGTTLTYDPPVAGAPVRIDRGAVVEFASPVAFVVAGQDPMHPFAVAQLMDSANNFGPSRPGATAVGAGFGPNLGDEEFVMLFPPAQFLKRYVFFSDPSYPTTTVTLVREKTAGEFRDVRIDCYGAVDNFVPVDGARQYEWATVDLVRAAMSVRGCTNGRHVVESDSPIGVVVWGLDSYSSYAYPAGGNAGTLQDIPIPL